MEHVIGFDIGGTKCAVIYAVADELKINFKERIEISTIGTYQEILKQLVAEAKKIQFKYPEIKENGTIGISCGGPLDSKNGLILSPPNLPDWNRVPIVAYLETELGLPAVLKNDADACALAEWKYGAGKGCQNLIFLTFGTGLGSGLILNGQLYEGTTGLAGEVGHIRLAKTGPIGHGKAGSFEGFCSGGGIARIAKEHAIRYDREGKKASYVKTNIEQITTKDVAEMAALGKQDALAIFDISGEYLGRGLAILIDILNPEMIIIGSIFARAGQYLTAAMNRSIGEEALQGSAEGCAVVPARLGEQIGDYAAVIVGLENNERR